MSTRDYEIFMRTNFTDRDKDQAAEHMVIKAARHLQVLMDMVRDEFPVEVCCKSKDSFHGYKEISMQADLFEGHEAAPEEEIEGLSPEMLEALSAMSKGDQE